MSSQVYGVGGFVAVAPKPISGKGVPAGSFKGQLGQQYFDTTTTPPTEYIFNGQTWTTGGASPATTTTLGSVYLATLAQTESGGAPSASYVSSANDVATALSAIVVGAGVPATTAQQGYVYLATNAQAQAGLLTTNYAINPGSLASVFAVPFALGSTTPAAVSATTLTTVGTA